MPWEKGSRTKFIPPASGNLPSEGKHILAKVYSGCREHSENKGSCAAIAWSAVRKAGYSKETYAEK